MIGIEMCIAIICSFIMYLNYVLVKKTDKTFIAVIFLLIGNSIFAQCFIFTDELTILNTLLILYISLNIYINSVTIQKLEFGGRKK